MHINRYKLNGIKYFISARYDLFKKKLLFVLFYCVHCIVTLTANTYVIRCPVSKQPYTMASPLRTYKIVAIKSVKVEPNKTFVKHAPLRSGMFLSKFGKRGARMHTGVDYAAPAGSHIYAVAPGVVTFSGWRGGYGQLVIIKHDNGLVSRYAHCSKILVHKQCAVQAGTIIGHVGKTGNARGSHLHFEILCNNKFLNPAQFLGTKNLSPANLKRQNDSCSQPKDGIGNDHVAAKSCLRSSSNNTDT